MDYFEILNIAEGGLNNEFMGSAAECCAQDVIELMSRQNAMICDDYAAERLSLAIADKLAELAVLVSSANHV